MSDTLKPRVVLGFDFGLKYIGVAVGQTSTHTARALTTLSARNGLPDWNHLAQLIQTWKPDALIVGIPLNMDDTEQPLTHAARQFAAQLQERYLLPIYPVDERLTSVEARARLFAHGGYRALQKKAIDSLAAQVILETWLAS
jgi:putative Holliday junction resolvase